MSGDSDSPILPDLYLVEQRFERPTVDDVDAAVAAQLGALDLGQQIKAGDSVALAVGSRGIRDIDRIVAAAVSHLRGLGAAPFVFPAMGSHGGGTAEGQQKVLADLGVTEARVGCEVRAGMDVVELGRLELASGGEGIPVLLDARAAAADHIGLINRIKPHTRFGGDVESGLLKMCLIGVGKREGARTYHRAIERHGWMPVVRGVTDRLIARAPLRFGLAMVQNAYEEIAELRGLSAERFWEAEPALLQRAKELIGRLPTERVDLLVVDEMGKEISGAGMDSNLTGRKLGSPMQVRHLFVRGLTEQTHGNALGIGLADFTTRRLVDAIDFPALYLNSRTAYRTDACKVPMIFDSDREALAAAIPMAGRESLAEHRLVWIRNTLALTRIVVSAALLPELAGRDDLSVNAAPIADELFDERGNLIRPDPA